jgi:hypothetical protein
MKLLHSKTPLPEEFMDESKTPSYAIISHTWGEDEITLEDIISNSIASYLACWKLPGFVNSYFNIVPFRANRESTLDFNLII